MTKRMLNTLCALSLASSIFGCASTEETTAQPALDQEDLAKTGSALNGSFEGCRGTALHVCDELVDPSYYWHHPSCQRNYTCLGAYWPCDVDCPAPTGYEIPNAKVVARGRVTPDAYIMVGYVWSAAGTGGFYSNSLDGQQAITGYGWNELQLGVGVNATGEDVVKVYCANDDWNASLADVTVSWANGATQSFTCNDDWSCSVDIPFNGGFTAACNFIERP